MAEIELIRVFVASPSDVQDERDALEEVVRRVNATVADLEPVQLRLVRWETDTRPSVGGDAQSLVTEQIGEKYEIFIGILWTRFGTPTPRAESGTMEEFEEAIRRHQRDPQSVTVMFYFKDAPQAPMEIDTEQLQKVQEFRRRFTDTGLYGTFTDTNDFMATLQITLSRLAMGWRRGVRTSPTSALKPARRPQSDEGEESDRDDESGEGVSGTVPEEEEEGFLDLVEQGVEGFEEVNEVTSRIAKEMESFGTDVHAGTKQMEDANDPSGRVDVKRARRAVNTVADRLDKFASILEREIDPFKAAFGKAIAAYGKAAVLLPDFGTDIAAQVEEAAQAADSLEEAIASVQKPLQELQQTISNQPRLTTRFNRGRSRALEALGALEREMAAARKSSQETAELFRQLLTRATSEEAG